MSPHSTLPCPTLHENAAEAGSAVELALKISRQAVASAEEKGLLEKYAPLVRRVAYALLSMKPAMLDAEDVFQDGMIGLLRAIRSNRGEPSEAQFASFAHLNIRGAIIDGYRTVGDISRSEYDSAKKIRQAVQDGRPVTAEQRAKADQLFTQAWTAPIPIDGDSEDTFQLSDPDPGPEQRSISNQLLRRAIDALQTCPLRDRNIFIACELQGEKHTLVAQRYQISTGRVSQILKEVREQVLRAIA